MTLSGVYPDQELKVPVGRRVECTFGAFRPRLLFLGDDRLELQIATPGESRTETVHFGANMVGEGLVMLSWIEADGAMVVHLHNYPAQSVISHARRPDGTLVRSAGTLQWLPPTGAQT